MNYILQIIISGTICFHITYGLYKFHVQDHIPIKFDVIKVRTEREIQNYPDRWAVLDFVGMVELYKGYTAEEHNLTTLDGYNLKLHRISGSPSKPKAKGKPVVFFQHGILSTSDCFIMTGPGKNLAYLLAESGYDVWLGNARGNTYSRSHVTLHPRSKQFWEFSWHEIGTIDVPTFIDYILKKTNQQQLIYVGHSMGTTASYVLLSKKPEYNTKISLVISLAPIAFWNKKKLPFVLYYGINNLKNLQALSDEAQYFEFMPQSSYVYKIGKAFCSNPKQAYLDNICSQVVKNFMPIIDLNRSNISYPEVLKVVPAGASVKSIFHYMQNAADQEFREYDYGSEINLKKYSAKTPPRYNLSLISSPVALFYGAKDYFGPSIEIVKILKNKLPNVIQFVKVPHETFNHVDFILANDVKELLYELILDLIKNHKFYYNYQ